MAFNMHPETTCNGEIYLSFFFMQDDIGLPNAELHYSCYNFLSVPWKLYSIIYIYLLIQKYVDESGDRNEGRMKVFFHFIWILKRNLLFCEPEASISFIRSFKDGFNITVKVIFAFKS